MVAQMRAIQTSRFNFFFHNFIVLAKTLFIKIIKIIYNKI